MVQAHRGTLAALVVAAAVAIPIASWWAADTVGEPVAAGDGGDDGGAGRSLARAASLVTDSVVSMPVVIPSTGVAG